MYLEYEVYYLLPNQAFFSFSLVSLLHAHDLIFIENPGIDTILRANVSYIQRLALEEEKSLMLGIASKIEPPTHSHEILISSTLLITKKDLFPLKITKSHSIYPRQLKDSKVQGYQIPTLSVTPLHLTFSQITLFVIKTKL